MSNQAIQLIQNGLGLQHIGSIAIALGLQTDGAAAQGVDSGQAAQDAHASVQNAQAHSPLTSQSGSALLVSRCYRADTDCS